MRLKLTVATALLAAAILPFQNCASQLPELAMDYDLGSSATKPASSCRIIKDKLGSQVTSGTFWIDPDGVLPNGVAPFRAYCDMDRDGGGWMLVIRNPQTTVFTNFNKTWNEYKAGFGDLTTAAGLGWVGNDRLAALTSAPKDLIVRTNNGDHRYTGFQVESEVANYRLNVLATPSSNDGGAFTGAFHHRIPFSTADRDNDSFASNCAAQFAAGWWYAGCYTVSVASNNQGNVYWRDSGGAVKTVTFIEFWVR